MTARSTDRYDVTGRRFTRSEFRRKSDQELLRAVDLVFPGGVVFHVIDETPDDSGDLMTLLIDGTSVIHFEIARLDEACRKLDYRSLEDVSVETVAEYRELIGQGKRRILLDRAVEDARERVAQSGS